MIPASQAERALIARVLIDPEQLAEMDGLAASDFYYEDLGKVYRVIMKRHSLGEAIDAVLVGEESGVDIDVMELSPASFAPIKDYVAAIKEAALRRNLVGVLDSARSRIASGEGDAIGDVSAAVERIIASTGVGGLRSAGSVVGPYRDKFLRRGTAGESITYGISALDSALLPMRAGRLVVVAARPGIGKTALAESVADHVATNFGPVLFVSLEMLAEDLIDRGLARMSGISAGTIIRGTADIKKLDEHLLVRGDTPITYIDDGGTTTSQILTAAQRVKLQNDGKLALVVVDYLQLVADKQYDGNEVYRVGGIAHALKRLSLKMKVPVLALAQLNRQLDAGGRGPKLSDLRDSGAIEQDADAVVIMTGRIDRPERTAHVLKQRQGSAGVVNLLFDGDTQRWDSGRKEATEW